jgi:hypothetical protein
MAYQLIKSEKFNQNYHGKAEWCQWEFQVNMPEQVGSQIVANQTLNGHIDELEKQGCQILEYRMWEDASPTWTTQYYIEVVATASPIAWVPIILAVLAIVTLLGLLVAWYMLKGNGNIEEYPDGGGNGGEEKNFDWVWWAVGGVGVVVLLALVVRSR